MIIEPGSSDFLTEGADALNYISSPFHAYLRDKKLPSAMPSVESDWSNVTITFLCLNRVHLSIRLLDSIRRVIPNFAGNILVMDNHSSPTQLDRLKLYLGTFPFPVTLKELDRNYGVAGGRNRAAQAIDTDWFLSLDNDIVFLENPIPSLKEAVDKTGAFFINPPILNEDQQTIFACGGNIYVAPYKDSYVLGNATAYQRIQATSVQLAEPFLCTYLFGTASFAHTQSFIDVGMFDDAMLVGFEDLEFSLRLYQKGLKVGAATKFCLAHAHEPATLSDDLSYENTRYSLAHCKASADHFYAKHGLHVWTQEVEDWLTDTRERVGLTGLPETQIWDTGLRIGETKPWQEATSSQKPSIALIADRRGWVFSNLAGQLIKHLGKDYNFSLFYSSDYKNTGLLLRDVCNYNLVHFFYRQDLYNLFAPWTISYFNSKGWNFLDFTEQVVGKLLITTSVFDHLFLADQEIRERDILFSGLTVGYSVSSKKLFGIYETIKSYPPPTSLIQDGVDLSFFKPGNLERLSETKRKIIVGWAGNSGWGIDKDGKDHKGFQTIIQSAIDQLQSEGLLIQGEFIDRDVNPRPFNQMPDYYNSIDIYLCASDVEGTPNPVLEAMACGVPIISTEVGIVGEVFGPLQAEYIVERDIGAFKAKIRDLVKHPEKRLRLSQENLTSIQGWDWSEKIIAWGEFFQTILNTYPAKAADISMWGFNYQDIRRQLLRERVQQAMNEMEEEELRRKNALLSEEAAIFSRELYALRNSRSYQIFARLKRSKAWKSLAWLGARLLPTR